jgi:hypothetical protein
MITSALLRTETERWRERCTISHPARSYRLVSWQAWHSMTSWCSDTVICSPPVNRSLSRRAPVFITQPLIRTLPGRPKSQSPQFPHRRRFVIPDKRWLQTRKDVRTLHVVGPSISTAQNYIHQLLSSLDASRTICSIALYRPCDPPTVRRSL